MQKVGLEYVANSTYHFRVSNNSVQGKDEGKARDHCSRTFSSRAPSVAVGYGVQSYCACALEMNSIVYGCWIFTFC